MASKLPTKASRDANLDALKSAAEEYFEQERTRLDAETKFLRAVLTGTGADEVGAQNLSAAVKSVQNEIDSYLFARSS